MTTTTTTAATATSSAARSPIVGKKSWKVNSTLSSSPTTVTKMPLSSPTSSIGANVHGSRSSSRRSRVGAAAAGGGGHILRNSQKKSLSSSTTTTTVAISEMQRRQQPPLQYHRHREHHCPGVSNAKDVTAVTKTAFNNETIHDKIIEDDDISYLRPRTLFQRNSPSHRMKDTKTNCSKINPKAIIGAPPETKCVVSMASVSPSTAKSIVAAPTPASSLASPTPNKTVSTHHSCNSSLPVLEATRVSVEKLNTENHYNSCCANDTILEGWLHKKTKHGQWVKRWYLIDSFGIYYTRSCPSSSSSTSPSSSPSYSSSSMKYIKLVDTRTLLRAKIVYSPTTNPMMFELLCYHPPYESPLLEVTTSSSRMIVLAKLKASTINEVNLWMNAIHRVRKQQSLMDEVVMKSRFAPVTVSEHDNIVSQFHGSTCENDVMYLCDRENVEQISTNATDIRCNNLKSSTNSNSTKTTLMTDLPHLQLHNKEDSLEILTSIHDSPLPHQNSVTDIDFQVTRDNESRHRDGIINGFNDPKMMNCSHLVEKECPTLSAKALTDKKKQSNNGCNDKEPDYDPSLDPKYQKYFAMLKVGLPKEVVQHAMKRDQLDPSILNLDPGDSLYCQQELVKGCASKDMDDLPLKNDPKYSKYFKMLKMGLSKDAVEHAMMRDKLDSSILNLDPHKSLSSQIPSKSCVDKDVVGLSLKEDPMYAKYFHMMKIGLPKEVAQHAMVRDQLDPNVLNMDPESPLTNQMEPSDKSLILEKVIRESTTIVGVQEMTRVKSKVRRKKVYWNRVDRKEGNIWSELSKLELTIIHDPKEIEKLFSRSEDAEKGHVQNDSYQSTLTTPKIVQAIDSKRGMNGDIVLRKLKLTPGQVAQMINDLDCNQLESVELKTLYEFMPTEEECRGLAAYLEHSSVGDLTPCEQFMVMMKDVKDSERKFLSMIFMSEFHGKMAELKMDIDHLIAACEELMSSKRFHVLLAMILRLVNEINSGGDDDASVAYGFTLDSLPKFGETKAFDKKTTVLHYLARVVNESNKDILNFQDDIKSVVWAKKVDLERLLSSVKSLCAESRVLTEVASKCGDDYRKSLKVSHKNIKFKAESVKKMQQKVTFLSGKEVPLDRELTHSERFAILSKLELERAVSFINEAKQKYTDMLGYFGEKMKSPQDFFGSIDQFVELFRRAVALIKTDEIKNIKNARKALALEAKVRAKSPIKSAGDDPNFDFDSDSNDIICPQLIRVCEKIAPASIMGPYDEEESDGGAISLKVDELLAKAPHLLPRNVAQENRSGMPASTVHDPFGKATIVVSPSPWSRRSSTLRSVDKTTSSPVNVNKTTIVPAAACAIDGKGQEGMDLQHKQQWMKSEIKRCQPFQNEARKEKLGLVEHLKEEIQSRCKTDSKLYGRCSPLTADPPRRSHVALGVAAAQQKDEHKQSFGCSKNLDAQRETQKLSLTQNPSGAKRDIAEAIVEKGLTIHAVARHVHCRQPQLQTIDELRMNKPQSSQKLQQYQVERKPSKLSLAVAAAAQRRASRTL